MKQYRQPRLFTGCCFAALRRLIITSGGLAVWLVCLLGLTAAAQSGRRVPPSPGEKPIVKIETREVLLPLRAYDAQGRDVGNLQPKDLIVVENDAPRAITSLKREPADIVLVLDLSNEIGTFKNGPRDWHAARGETSKAVLPDPVPRELAKNFVARLAEADRLAIIQYSDKVQVLQDWTDDPAQAQRALEEKYRIGLKASFYDALALAAEKLQSRPSGRRVIVLVSDGLDSSSRLRRQPAWAAVARAQATVYVIGWTDVLQREIASAITWIKKREMPGTATQKRLLELRRHLAKLEGAAAELRQLAETSGGELFLPPSFAEFVAAPQLVLREIGAQYTLAYLTERKPSLDPQQEVQVFATRPGLTLRTRRSYYADGEARQ
jgi:Ca-activated chloride channel family protein